MRTLHSLKIYKQKHYKEGVKDGVFVYYNKEGKELSRELWANGTGLFKSYYRNDTLKEEGMYLRGVRDGTWKNYSMDGNLQMEVEYKNGKIMSTNSY